MKTLMAVFFCVQCDVIFVDLQDVLQVIFVAAFLVDYVILNLMKF